MGWVTFHHVFITIPLCDAFDSSPNVTFSGGRYLTVSRYLCGAIPDADFWNAISSGFNCGDANFYSRITDTDIMYTDDRHLSARCDAFAFYQWNSWLPTKICQTVEISSVKRKYAPRDMRIYSFDFRLVFLVIMEVSLILRGLHHR